MRSTIIPALLAALPFAAAIPAPKTVKGFHTITTTGSPSGTVLPPSSIPSGALEGSTNGALEDADTDYGVTTVTLSAIETVVVVVPGVTTFSAAPPSITVVPVTDEVLIEDVIVWNEVSSSWFPSTSTVTYTYAIEVEESTTTFTTTRLL
ncbi:hypothetical protein VPNG_02821 [Cytospora leucostoma]|uniref:Uncharacterized protein n=1 Tax=Cytospora leucostoma TaxID=1230097 RepID=A0A423XJ65_9PEZI|nr:hypothetical protein VPNG_02821 [Cytospora leucostoma]